jgi:hypothetical protein
MLTASTYLSPLNTLTLPILRARVTLRLLTHTQLPEYKGAMLRGGFGYAFQRASCPQSCWNKADGCALAQLCPFRWIFATPRPPGIEQIHDLHDIPRPFVIEPPTDGRREYRAGEALEFGLVVIGRAIDHLPYFLYSFEQLGRMGLGRDLAPARLERVEVLRPWQPIGTTIYQDGRAIGNDWDLPLITAHAIAAHAAQLPADLRIELLTPLRLKARGNLLRSIDLGALVQAICWRLNTLSIFHGNGPWDVDHRTLVEQARAVAVEQRVRWVELLRTSTRGDDPQTMPQGGLVGSAILRGVPEAVRSVLLAGSVIHVGKSATFGHGGMGIS